MSLNKQGGKKGKVEMLTRFNQVDQNSVTNEPKKKR